MGAKKAVVVSSHSIVDTVSGELIRNHEIKISQKETEPPYVKMYLEDISRIYGLPEKASRLLKVLVKNMSYTNIVAMYKPIKLMICSELNYSLNTVNAAVNDLVKQGVIIRVARGLYMVEPNLFGKGRWEDIKKIRMTVEYDEKGRKSVNTEVIKQLELF
jgi:predicted transcriptional regulator